MSQAFGHIAVDGPGPVASRRARVFESVVALCAAAPRDRTPDADAALAQAFLSVIADADRTVRSSLARRIAVEDWAPHAVVAELALDEIEIARPLLAHSRQLEDADLLHVLETSGLDHRVEVARRPALGPSVSDRASRDEEALVLTALAANEHSTLSLEALRRLVDAARRISALRVPLSRRADLTADLAETLVQVVGEGLRRDLSRRFDLPAGSHPPKAPGVRDEEAEMERSLVGKLRASGELRPGFLLKCLREGRLGLFEEALAVLAQLPRPGVSDAVAGAGPERLASACAAAGVDRSVFPTLLALVRSVSGGAPADTPASSTKVRAALAETDPQAARRRFLQDGAG